MPEESTCHKWHISLPGLSNKNPIYITTLSRIGQYAGLAMSLYYETAPFLSASPANGSLKSRVFSGVSTKSPTIQIFALASEASKWDTVLAEVIERSQLLQNTRRVKPGVERTSWEDAD